MGRPCEARSAPLTMLGFQVGTRERKTLSQDLLTRFVNRYRRVYRFLPPEKIGTRACTDFCTAKLPPLPPPGLRCPAARVCSPCLPLTRGPSPSSLRARERPRSASMSESEFNESSPNSEVSYAESRSPRQAAKGGGRGHGHGSRGR